MAEVQAVTGELGISGTANYSGDIYSELNPRLYHQSAFGQAGTREWGEWENIGKTDPDVAAGLDFVQGQIRDARVDVEEAGESQPNRALAKAQADFLRWNLLERCEPGWSEVLRQMTRGLLPGFALHELVAGEVSHPALPGGRGWGLLRLAERLPISIHPTNGWLEEGGDLAFVRQLGPRNSGSGTQWADIMLPASKLQLMSWGREGNNYLGVSAFRSVYYLTRVREQLLKIVGISYIREGAGVPVAQATDANAALTPKQRQKLFKLLANMVLHENAAIVLPAGWTINWVYSPGANKGHVIDAWKALGEVILRQVQAQQMVLGVNGTGSRSVGEVHDASADQFVAGVLATFENVINGQGGRAYTGLARKVIDWNWGPQPAYPRVTLKPRKTKLSPTDRTTAIKTAVEAGALTLTAADENVVRDELGLAPISEEDRAAEKEKKAALAPSFAPTPSPFAPKQKARASASRRGPFVPSRPLRASEKHLDVQGLSDFLDGAKASFELEVKPAVIELLARAAPAIAEAMKDGDPSELAALKLDTSRLADIIATHLDVVMAHGKATVHAELKRGLGEKLAEERRAEDVPPKLTAAAADGEPKSMQVLESLKDMLVRKMTSRLRLELESEAVDAVRTDGDASDVVARTLTNQLDSAAFRSDAGSVLTKVFNVGRDEAAKELDVGLAEYSAILDGNQCGACNSMDGRPFELSSSEYEANLPPNRDCDGMGNCRCLMSYLPGTGSKK